MQTALFALTLFLSGALADLFWAFYLLNMAAVDRTGEKLYRRRAAWWSVAMGVCSWLMVDGMVENKWLTLIWLVGLWCGTYYAHPIRQYFIGNTHV